MSRHHHNLRGWATARKKALTRAGYRCSECGKAGRLEVHHHHALDSGGDGLAQDNLTAMCRSCHIERHRNSPAVHVQGQAGVESLLWRGCNMLKLDRVVTLVSPQR